MWADGAGGRGLYYNVHRWYSVGTGRFTQGDRYLPPSWKDPNLYSYSRNRPTILADPKGLFVIDPSCDCTPPWNPAENIPKAIGQAGNFPSRPKCQEILRQHGVWPCVPNRFGPDELGKGPLIKCQRNPPGTDACGETTLPVAGVPLTIHLYPGGANCPRSTPPPGISVTLFHEVVHSCNPKLRESTVFEITEVCTGWR